MQAYRLTPHEIGQVVDFMRQASGNDFTDKEKLVGSKMGALCSSTGYERFRDLWDAAQQPTIAGSQLKQRIIDEFTTSYSYFYREKAHFELLGRLIAQGDLPVGTPDLRVWSAGCATGEEPYNIAMALEDARAAGTLHGDYAVVGSDISARALQVAKAGRYSADNASRMPPHWRNLYCKHDDQEYCVAPRLRTHVELRLESVFAPRPDLPFDLVMCRNMLIYFDQASIERFCALVRGRVKSGGYLFLGHTEIMGQIDGFSYIAPSVWRRD